jgi:hypothetical protein
MPKDFEAPVNGILPANLPAVNNANVPRIISC